jgi:hypothetical protein
MPCSGRMALGVLLFLTGCAASPAGKCNLEIECLVATTAFHGAPGIRLI